jgi:hypothetical protein
MLCGIHELSDRFCANQSSLDGETLFGDANLLGRPAFSIFIDNGFMSHIMVWPTPGSPSHQKRGNYLLLKLAEG